MYSPARDQCDLASPLAAMRSGDDLGLSVAFTLHEDCTITKVSWMRTNSAAMFSQASIPADAFVALTPLF